MEPLGREGAVGSHAAATVHVPGEGKEAPAEAGQGGSQLHAWE